MSSPNVDSGPPGGMAGAAVQPAGSDAGPRFNGRAVLHDCGRPFGDPQPLDATLRDLAQAAAETGASQDLYGKGASLEAFEARAASLLGKEAACFMMSGVQAQLIAIRVHADELRSCRRIGLHGSSHLLRHEHRAFEHLWGFQCIELGEPCQVITTKDVQRAVDGGRPRIGTVVLELPQRENGGACISWRDLVLINKRCTTFNVRLHLDGARLWECQPYYGKTFAEICGLFDSVYVSFYKGLGGLTGAMLAGSQDFIARCRIWQRRLGGNLYTAAPFWLSSSVALKRTLSTFEDRFMKLRRVAVLMHHHFVSQGWLRLDPVMPQSTMVHVYFRGFSPADVQAICDQVLLETGILLCAKVRPVPHYKTEVGVAAPPREVEAGAQTPGSESRFVLPDGHSAVSFERSLQASVPLPSEASATDGDAAAPAGAAEQPAGGAGEAPVPLERLAERLRQPGELQMAVTAIETAAAFQPVVVREQAYMEFVMGPANMAVPDEVYLRGWTVFCEIARRMAGGGRVEEAEGAGSKRRRAPAALPGGGGADAAEEEGEASGVQQGEQAKRPTGEEKRARRG